MLSDPAILSVNAGHVFDNYRGRRPSPPNNRRYSGPHYNAPFNRSRFQASFPQPIFSKLPTPSILVAGSFNASHSLPRPSLQRATGRFEHFIFSAARRQTRLPPRARPPVVQRRSLGRSSTEFPKTPGQLLVAIPVTQSDAARRLFPAKVPRAAEDSRGVRHRQGTRRGALLLSFSSLFEITHRFSLTHSVSQKLRTLTKK